MSDIPPADIIGRRYGRLVVTSVEPAKNWRLRITCACDCGGARVAPLRRLEDSYHPLISCGCARRPHGMTDTREHVSWLGMTYRCRSPGSPDFQHYGGRGIVVCDRWQGPKGFINFLADMGPRPSGSSLDRIDVNGNYEPANCRWASLTEQARNRTDSKLEPHEVVQVRWLTSIGVKQRVVAAFFGVHQSTVSYIKSGKTGGSL